MHIVHSGLTPTSFFSLIYLLHYITTWRPKPPRAPLRCSHFCTSLFFYRKIFHSSGLNSVVSFSKPSLVFYHLTSGFNVHLICYQITKQLSTRIIALITKSCNYYPTFVSFTKPVNHMRAGAMTKFPSIFRT